MHYLYKTKSQNPNHVIFLWLAKIKRHASALVLMLLMLYVNSGTAGGLGLGLKKARITSKSRCYMGTSSHLVCLFTGGIATELKTKSSVIASFTMKLPEGIRGDSKRSKWPKMNGNELFLGENYHKAERHRQRLVCWRCLTGYYVKRHGGTQWVQSFLTLENTQTETS